MVSLKKLFEKLVTQMKSVSDTCSSLSTSVNTLLDRDIYSTSEKRIGTWINGKPIYRKTINIGSWTMSPGGNIKSHGISNVNIIINTKIIMQYNTDYYSLWNTQALNASSTNIAVTLSSTTGLTWNNVWCTLEYTKTTD